MKVKPGDIFEIKTKKGLAYAQYVLRKPKWGALIRVLPGCYSERPQSFTLVASQLERFVTFFPLQAATDKQLVVIVGHEALPEAAQRFPLFRARGHIDREGFIHDWWLWNGEREWKIGKLSSEQRKLPIQEVWNDTLLIERIEESWTPEAEPLREPGTLRKLFFA